MMNFPIFGKPSIKVGSEAILALPNGGCRVLRSPYELLELFSSGYP
jgi:hypothetical protein